MINTMETKTDIKTYIDLCKVKKGNVTNAEIAKHLGTSSQNLSIKYKRNSFRVIDLECIADALNADLSIVFIDRDTGEPLIEGTTYTQNLTPKTQPEPKQETTEETIPTQTHEQVEGGTEDENKQNTTEEPASDNETQEPSNQADQIAPSFYNNNNN